MENNWENNIIIPATKREFTLLPPVINFSDQEHFIDIKSLGLDGGIDGYIKKDNSPLPINEDREGYHGERHYDYWLSGLGSAIKIINAAKKNGIKISVKTRILDFGCASGRVLRHLAYFNESESWGCDINENHVIWCNRYLPENVKVFHSTSIPHLQVEDAFFDLICCFSVFTHIETFETSWLCELRRITKENGIIYLTISDESTWSNMPKDWGVGSAIINHPDFNPKYLETGFPGEKFVSRWIADKSYSSNVFYKIEYIKNVWRKFFDILEIIPLGDGYQTILVLKKTN